MTGSTRIFLTTVITILVAGAVVIFIGLPLKRQANADRVTLAEREGQLVSLQQVTERIDCMQSEIVRLKDALEFFEHRLPQKREIDVILSEVWRIAESKSLVQRSVRTTAPETAARYSSQPISLSLSGSFEGFYEFLLGLERLPRLTKVRQLQISKVPAEDGTVLADLLMDIYFEKQE
jgi:type IV pilus assembly protein PilO